VSGSIRTAIRQPTSSPRLRPGADIAPFSHFIPCGIWAAIFILGGLLKNTSDIQPTTVRAETKGQLTTVRTLSFLRGIKLMPRSRNWKDLTFFRPSKDAKYHHIDTLDSQLIEDHWPDLMQVGLSIKAGTISSAGSCADSAYTPAAIGGTRRFVSWGG
jgi:TnpA family transposase